MNPVVHFEMPYEDNQRISDFYAKAFDWKFQVLGPEMGNYVVVSTTESDENGRPKIPGAINGGFYRKPVEGELGQSPSVVISVDDIEASMKKIMEAGGEIFGEPMNIPGVGLYVTFQDTEGNKVSILQPSQEM